MRSLPPVVVEKEEEKEDACERACDEKEEENREAGKRAGARVPPCLPTYLTEMRLEEAKKKSSTPTRCCPESESEEGRKEKKSVGVEGGRGGKRFPIFKRWQWS